jgi:chromosomal replication initiation ATPase DnaA
MRQIALPLDELRPGVTSSLIITQSNAPVVSALAQASSWPGRCAILCGPARSGKSLMARYFVMQADGDVIDNADTAGEEVLFNAWNRAQENGRPLLLISDIPPADWEIALADLRSRLAAATLLHIPPPDDELVAQLLQKHFADRGTVIGIEALGFASKRIERRYGAIETFARDANALALAENAPINMGLVKRLLS